MENALGAYALVSSPGETPGLDSAGTITDMLADAGFSIETDPALERPGARYGGLPPALIYAPEALPAHLTTRQEGWAYIARQNRKLFARISHVVIIDFTHDEARAREALEFFAAQRPADKTTLAVLPHGPNLHLPQGIRPVSYRSPSHLTWLLQRELGLPESTRGSDRAFTMVFSAPASTFGLLPMLLSQALLTTLRTIRFCGRCDCYMSVRDTPQEPHVLLSLGIFESTERLHRRLAWFSSLQAQLRRQTDAQNADITLLHGLSRFVSLSRLRVLGFREGAVEFEHGIPVRVLSPHAVPTWFEQVSQTALDKTSCPPSWTTF